MAQVTLKRDICCTRVRSTLLNVFHGSGAQSDPSLQGADRRKIDENPEIQTIQETYEGMSTSEQNLDIPVPEMMKQSSEVTKIISQDRIQQKTLEQISDTSVSEVVKELDEPCKVLSRDRPQRQFDSVIVGMNQDITDKTRNTGSEKSGNQTMMDMMSIGDCDSSMERECDVSILIKQMCAESDVMSQCVLCFSGMTDQLRRKTERCMRLIGTLQGGAGVSSGRAVMNSEKVSGSDCSSVPSSLNEGTSDGGHCGPQNSEIVAILKQLVDERESTCRLLTRWSPSSSRQNGLRSWS